MRYAWLLLAWACSANPPPAAPGATVTCGETHCTPAQYCVHDTTIAGNVSPGSPPAPQQTGYRCTDEAPRNRPGSNCTPSGEHQFECTYQLP